MAPPDPWTDYVDWMTANVGRGVPAAVAKRNILKVRRAHPSDPLPLVGWQEIDEDNPAVNEHHLIDVLFGPGFKNVGMAHKEPISIPTGFFDLVGPCRTDKIMDGVPVSAPGGASPNRFLIRQRVRPKGLKGIIVAANFHLANFEVNDPRWKKSLDRAQALIAQDVEAGHTVVYGCDSNANRPANMPKMHPKERRVVAKGNDYLGIIEGSVKVRVHGTFSINLTIDGHNAEGARMSFKDAR